MCMQLGMCIQAPQLHKNTAITISHIMVWAWIEVCTYIEICSVNLLGNPAMYERAGEL